MAEKERKVKYINPHHNSKKVMIQATNPGAQDLRVVTHKRSEEEGTLITSPKLAS